MNERRRSRSNNRGDDKEVAPRMTKQAAGRSSLYSNALWGRTTAERAGAAHRERGGRGGGVGGGGSRTRSGSRYGSDASSGGTGDADAHGGGGSGSGDPNAESQGLV